RPAEARLFRRRRQRGALERLGDGVRVRRGGRGASSRGRRGRRRPGGGRRGGAGGQQRRGQGGEDRSMSHVQRTSSTRMMRSPGSTRPTASIPRTTRPNTV